MARELTFGTAGFDAAFAQLLDDKRETSEEVDQTVAAIIDDVRTRGDAALLDYTRRFDRLTIEADRLAITAGEIESAVAACPQATIAALEGAARRIDDFHRRQLPDDLSYTDEAGVRLGYRWTALASAGLYVPGGTAAYPSSVLMNALPARVAGVGRLVMVVPTPDGRLNPLVLAAARIAGVTEIYRVGGAQAVAALAFGTDTIAPVDKIVGPGNAYVAAAKRLVFGDVGIEMIAGPTEVVIAADATANPAWVAADLLAQAEHDELAVPILVAVGKAVAERVTQELDRQLAQLPRKAIAAKAVANQGVAIVVDDAQAAIGLVNQLAPEHAGIALADARKWADLVTCAGAVFVGDEACEALGDYFAGPSHVLPTGGSARFSSPLGVGDFLKRTSYIEYGAVAVAKQAGAVSRLAEVEGLSGHARAVLLRAQALAKP